MTGGEIFAIASIARPAASPTPMANVARRWIALDLFHIRLARAQSTQSWFDRAWAAKATDLLRPEGAGHARLLCRSQRRPDFREFHFVGSGHIRCQRLIGWTIDLLCIQSEQGALAETLAEWSIQPVDLGLDHTVGEYEDERGR
ncbi:MAG: hypothetical protein E5X33_29960 [Mesorhizobium sp.]|uniref:hypothetical protein n=1 Tax=Mesorhizobium sp. TaxID=1871066 RepID=UPI00121FAD7C|nr:hypothetical protein [Mesorhizobium sp.]TIR16156.1 MAG: hypothetical protein E5X33_29960 [Mesorhizobium sp.]